MNYVCGYLFLRFKDSREIRQINPSQTSMNLQYPVFVLLFMRKYQNMTRPLDETHFTQVYKHMENYIILPKCETILGYNISNRYEFVTFSGQRT